MKWQRKVLQMKGQDKTSEEELSEAETGNLLKKEVRVMILRNRPKLIL